MKNVIAIAAGIVDGTGAGDNAKAALLSRGLAEITRLGTALGAKPQTFVFCQYSLLLVLFPASI